MRKPFLLALAALSLAAQDRLRVGVQIASLVGSRHHYAFHDGGDGWTTHVEGTSRCLTRSQFGLEGAWKVLRLGRLDLCATAGWRASAKADMQTSRTVTNTGPLGVSHDVLDGKVGTLAHQSLALGIEASLCLPLEVGGGLQVRRERLTLTSVDFPSAPATTLTTTTTRPWLSAHVGMGWKAQGLAPFLRLTAALPLTHTTFDLEGPKEDRVRSFAPRGEVSLQVGLRF